MAAHESCQMAAVTVHGHTQQQHGQGPVAARVGGRYQEDCRQVGAATVEHLPGEEGGVSLSIFLEGRMNLE